MVIDIEIETNVLIKHRCEIWCRSLIQSPFIKKKKKCCKCIFCFCIKWKKKWWIYVWVYWSPAWPNGLFKMKPKLFKGLGGKTWFEVVSILAPSNSLTNFMEKCFKTQNEDFYGSIQKLIVLDWGCFIIFKGFGDIFFPVFFFFLAIYLFFF